MLATMSGIRARTTGGGSMPGTGTMPTVSPTIVRRSAISWISSTGASTLSSVQNDTCSNPSAPAATASAIACTACACAVTWSPCRCASSTAARRTSRVNWGRC